ncbi:putative MFS transporter [Actinoplanes missouriensis 431]|uniref:Putative MFS transporter n=1 Tax=Actinoplanes missouriensis (strain ATCC 14538 / DSM 43046 / CBS 188.64 / JCM 3121 / NBRC 102363 / NCIMB 12654 / NRRL B-3342 / UNCC 431) TaxID=512565 RepID=I0H5E6_ACTM4|nr:MFS transporter [Actinoplanes missouriensis]BAL88233.1 putative MFS transporter [Actinoplanes missouriensis 431]
MAISSYIDDPEAQLALHQRTLSVVMASQVFSGAGLAAGVTVGALLTEQMLGSSAFAGVPAALYAGGSAIAALTVGRLSQRLGRRAGLVAGYVAGTIGGVGVVVAAGLGSVVLLFLSLLVYGAGTATNLQARYAGTDLSGPHRRGRAVSSVLVTTTVGAVIGPNLVAATGRAAENFALPALAGPFALAAVAYAIAGLILFLLLRPDPLLVSQAMQAQAGPATAAGPRTAPRSSAGVTAGAATMILTQLVMVAVMTMTPVHMQNHGHDLAATGLVISLHIAAMYLPSLVTGILVDRVGRVPVAVASGVTLLAAGLVSATAPEDSVAQLALALILLGLGWNLGLVAGTAMISDAAPIEQRAKIQGNVDLCIALAGAGGGIASSLVMSATSYATLSIAGGLLGLAMIPFVAAGARPSRA